MRETERGRRCGWSLKRREPPDASLRPAAVLGTEDVAPSPAPRQLQLRHRVLSCLNAVSQNRPILDRMVRNAPGTAGANTFLVGRSRDDAIVAGRSRERLCRAREGIRGECATYDPTLLQFALNASITTMENSDWLAEWLTS
jgi:hypothetical protein